MIAETRPAGEGHRVEIALIKGLHTLLFLLISASILYVFWAGLSGRGLRRARPAAAIALLECAIVVANRGRCPLTDLAEHLGADSGRVSDIFLPRWFADRIPYIFTPPLVIGLAGIALRTRRGPRDSRPRLRFARSDLGRPRRSPRGSGQSPPPPR